MRGLKDEKGEVGISNQRRRRKDEIQLRPSQSKAVFKLISLNTEEEYILSGEKSFIGRSAENDICINDKTVSGRHCVLEKKENTFFIRDLQSSNGTYVNGKRLGEAEAELKNGYILSFANNKFKFAVVDLPTKEQKKVRKLFLFAQVREDAERLLCCFHLQKTFPKKDTRLFI